MAESTVERTRKRTKPPRKVVKFPDASPPNQPPAEQTPEPSPPAELPEPPTAAQAPPQNFRPFPVPPKARNRGGYITPEEGIEYWHTVHAEFPDRVIVYVNREWPVLNHTQDLTRQEQALIAAKQRKPPAKYIDKLSDPYEADWKADMLHRYGSGTYKLYLNDAGIGNRGGRATGGGGKQTPPELAARNVCKWTITVNDTDSPPVLDPSRGDKGLGILDLQNPVNQSYITDLRLRGVLPPLDTGGEDVGTSEKLAGTIDSLAGQVGELKQEQLINRIREEMGGAGGAQAVQIKMLELLIATVTRNNNAPQTDTAAPLVQLFQSQVSALQQELREERQQRRQYEDSIRERANQPPPDPFAQLERLADTLKKAKDILGMAGTGGVGETVVRHASKMSGTLEFFSELIPKILDAPILNALAQKIATAGAGATLTNPAPGAAAGAPSSDAQLLRFVQDVITPAMVEYLEDGATGTDFAEWVHCGFPSRLHELQSRGPAVIISTYESSPLWPRLMPREMQFRHFVEQFCAWRPLPEAPEDEEPEAAAAAAGANGSNGAAARFEVNTEAQVIDLDEPIEGAPIA